VNRWWTRLRQFLHQEMAPVLPLFLVQFFSGAWLLPQSSFFPIYLEEQLHASPFWIAAVVAVGQASGLAVALYGGRLSDSWGSKRVLVLGLAGGALVSLVFLLRFPPLVVLLWMVGGATISLHTLGGSSYLTRAAVPHHLGVLSAFYALSLTLGGALSSPLAGQLLDSAGFAVYGLTGMILVALTALWALRFLSPQPPAQNGSHPGQLPTRLLAHRPVVQLLMGLRFLPTLYYGMASVLIPLLINDLAGNKTTVALYSTASLVVASAAQLWVGRAADRYGHRWPTLISYGVLILAALGLALFAQELWGVFLFGVLGIAAAWALAALLFVLVADGVAQPEHGRTFGLLHATWSIAMISGSLLGGALLRVAPGLPFLLVALFNLFSIVLSLAFFARIERGEGADPRLAARTP
jgi:MFS family permease